jgi:hypothetical protein
MLSSQGDPQACWSTLKGEESPFHLGVINKCWADALSPWETDYILQEIKLLAEMAGTSGFSLNSDDFGAFLPVDHHELVAGCMARQTPR